MSPKSKGITPLSKVNLTNDFLFGQVFSSAEVVKEFLECLFQHSIPELTYVKDQETHIDSYKGKSSRFDIIAHDAEGNIFDIEVQGRALEGLPQRVRIYHSHIDRGILFRGQSYEDTPDSCVIFICNYDPFGYGDMVYLTGTNFRIWRHEEVPDGRLAYYLNITHTNSEQAAAMPEIAALLKYMSNSNGIDNTCRLTKLVSERTIAVKNDNSKEEAYMLWSLKEKLDRADHIKEGRREYASALKTLGEILKKEGKTDEFVEAASNSEYAEELFQKYHIAY